MRHYHNKSDPKVEFNPKQAAIPLPPGPAMAHAAQDKLNRRPVSQAKSGALKCSGKWSPTKVARYRAASLAIPTKQRDWR